MSYCINQPATSTTIARVGGYLHSSGGVVGVGDICFICFSSSFFNPLGPLVLYHDISLQWTPSSLLILYLS